MPSTKNSKSTKSKDASEAKRNALRSQVAALHAEMEIVGYDRHEQTGQAKRKVSRHTMKERTIKRRTLEKEDIKDLAVRRDESTKKRLRGSKAALEDEVVKGSLIFGASASIDGDDDDDEEVEEIEEEYSDKDDEDYIDDGSEDNDFEDNDQDGGDDDNYDDDDEGEEGRYELLEPDHDQNDDDDSMEDENETSPKDKNIRKRPRVGYQLPTNPADQEKVAAAKKQFPQKKIARTMYRLKNFKSHRMAEKHGEALGRHALGLNRSAVATLKEVASAAPIAPQVYSSLGLVYESMLTDEMKKTNALKVKDQEHESTELNDPDTEGKEMNACIELAKKTYGSYHLAALLCKLDYTLWLRAGDAAMKISSLHNTCLTLPPNLDANNEQSDGDSESPDDHHFSTVEEYTDYHRKEKHRWLEEAKDDYLAADNIHPPGIAVPAKLAHAQIQLGNLSEALTILTDLKNSSLKSNSDTTGSDGLKSRTELERSYAVWLLYADLMLIIGYECNKWNRGEQTNNNYMFRRWLRKYSDTFDWRERRLQALCLALEAAAGTKCCEKLVSWMQDRAVNAHNKQDTYDVDQLTPFDGDKDVGSDKLRGNENGANNTLNSAVSERILPHRLSLDEITKRFDNEREILIARNRLELEQFDKLSAELNLPSGSKEVETRLQDRDRLLKSHKAAIFDLAGKFRLDKIAIESSRLESDENQQKAQPLPLSASRASVCDIASQLMKLCVGMELFSFGGLVASVVSLYFKARAERSEQRKMKLKIFDQRRLAATSNILQLSNEVYDDLYDDEANKASDDDESMIYLSDEEGYESLENVEEHDLTNHGVLPPELQFLHGLCLVGEGGSDFLAERLVRSVTHLDDEYVDHHQLVLDNVDSDETSLEIYRRTMSDTLTKSAGYALLIDIVAKTKKGREWSHRLLPIYDKYFEEIQKSDEVKVLQVSPSALSSFMITKRNHYVKVLLATQRMQLVKANALIPAEGENRDNDLNEAYKISMAIVDTIYRYRTTLLLEIQNRDIDSDTKETICILSGCFRIMSACLESDKIIEDESRLVEILSRMRTAVCWFCQTTIPNHNDAYSSQSNGSTESWRYFPISSEWQTEELKTLSRRSYNLCVSCNVSGFSGWEKEEFDLKLMRRKQGQSFFGINIKGTQVAGYLDRHLESELSSQWKKVQSLLPMLAYIDFDNSVANVKQAAWYTTAMDNLEQGFKDVPISTLAEDEALYVCLMFSKTSLLLAQVERDELKRQCLIRNSMSILLPLSQFSLDQSLWDSDIGTNAIRHGGVSEWDHFAQNADATVAKAPPKKSSGKKPSRPQSKHTSDIVQYKNTSPLKKLVKVPVEILLKEWNGKEDFDDSDEEEDDDALLSRWSQKVSGAATMAMKRVDFTVKKLRQSATINSLQKASLEVAVALLDLILTKECQNPFLCLHHAAVFASQGAKGGNYDEDFKKPLPEETECTPIEALVTLGRADCLRAIHFTDEAMYLCSFVARVCRLHRDKTSEYSWTPKWRVIAILMYTISLAIDATISSFMEESARDAALESWEKEVKAEIARARSDAISLQKVFSHEQFNNSKANQTNSDWQNEDDQGDAGYDDEMDEDYDNDYDLDEFDQEEEISIEEQGADMEFNEGAVDENMHELPPALDGPITIQMGHNITSTEPGHSTEGGGVNLDEISFVPI